MPENPAELLPIWAESTELDGPVMIGMFQIGETYVYGQDLTVVFLAKFTATATEVAKGRVL